MSQNTGRKPRHSKNGAYTHECAWCGVTFKDDCSRTKYCTFEHKQAANNKRFYERHRREMIYRVMLSKARNNSKASRAAGGRQRKSQKADFDSMSNEELLAYVQNNPHAIRVRK